MSASLTSLAYLVAGVLFYGLIGWLLSLWLGQAWLVPVGVLTGLGLGMYMVFARYRYHEAQPDDSVAEVHTVGRRADRAEGPVGPGQDETTEEAASERDAPDPGE